MKKIVKGNSPPFFEEWKTNFIKRNGSQPHFKDDFVGEIKQSFKYELLKEQGYICCYCMMAVDFDSHIEHFIPQSKGGDDLDYYNMFISCNGYKSDRSHCGQ